MKKFIAILFLGVMVAGCLVADRTSAQMPEGRPAGEVDRAISELLNEEAAAPTSPANVAARYQKLMDLVRAMMQNNIPLDDVLPPQEGKRIEMLIQRGEYGQAAPAVAEVIRGLGARKGAEQHPPIERASEPRTYLETSLRTMSTVSAGNGLDADNVLWGTEVYMQSLATSVNDILTNVLPVRYLKVRFQINFFSTGDGTSFSPEVCMPSPARCMARFNTDKLANTFKERGWSMIPLFSNDHGKPVTPGDIENYVNFVDWFVSRYRTAAAIRYVELVNAPVSWWKGTPEQLAELNNRIYERVKGKYPDIMVGTPGFEYWVDTARDDKSVREIEYFLDKRNNVKFDFWAYHGYPVVDLDSIAVKKIAAFYPPTKKAAENKYAGPAGIIEIRKKLDANGWTDRVIIDSEHTNIMSKAKPFVSEDEDLLDVAYTVQELVIKRTLAVNGRPALAGIIPLKIGPRGDKGEFLFASLKPDGSPTMTVRAVGLLIAKLKEFKYSSHISGEFDAENQPWIEQFTAAGRELYVFFKPFVYQKGREPAFDGQTVTYKLTLSRTPSALVLTSALGKTSYPPPGPFIVIEATNTPQYLEVRYE